MSKKISERYSGETCFIRFLACFFNCIGETICNHPRKLIVISTLLTLLGTVKIPITKMTNEVSDFTPSNARSMNEYETYRKFFANQSVPNTIFVFVTSKKKEEDMFDVDKLNETVQILDFVSKNFKLRTPFGRQTFEEYCSAFCTINEPIRHFFSGMYVASQYGNDTTTGRHLDLGYPITTVLGRKIHLDPNFFGVKIAVNDSGQERILPVSEISSVLMNNEKQVFNNIRGISLVVLQFRSELPLGMHQSDLEEYEAAIVKHFHNYHSEHVEVSVFTDTFLTSEIVRSGLTLLPFLVIGFTIMVIFSVTTFYISAYFLDQLSVDRFVLAFMACVCPFMACGAAIGGMLWVGFRFGSILCVTPFLVLAIGVDDAYLMVNAWQQITQDRKSRNIYKDDPEADLKSRICEMLVDTGPSVAITTITNVLAFTIGVFTSASEIQLFSIGNAFAVFVDFVFQLTIYGALMVVLGRREIAREKAARDRSAESSNSSSTTSSTPSSTPTTDRMISTKEKWGGRFYDLLNFYCAFLMNKCVAVSVLMVLVAYLVMSVMGTLRIRPEIRPVQLFAKDSSLLTVFTERQNHIIPFYGAAFIFVENPGDIWDPARLNILHSLVADFESLPESVGRYSTKFWLRDFEDFLRQSDGSAEVEMDDGETGGRGARSKYAELRQFLEWPEFSYWKGFVQLDKRANESEPHLSRFFFTTAFRGSQLLDWSNRAKLLNEWRAVADHYPQLNVTVYEQDAKFLDIIETMIPQAIQSAVFTFISMFIVAMLFINHIPTLLIATFSILSTSIGVCGVMSWWGADLDPIFASAMVMSIGFSVDIPAHIAYHYHQTGAHMTVAVDRLKHTISRVGFPILQASLSTILCVASLFCVEIHMALIFAKTMLLVVVIGMVHGLVVIPVIFGIASWCSPREKHARSHSSDVSSTTISTMISVTSCE